ncbi:hypothetical protein ACUTAF_01975 [Pseudomonas sp. SP16.1]|uniref:hypothetical protein n=1 Tax=Pseudomonas sp. SP16.1 TaxID=3458854 RepID=UPI00404576DD
MLSEDQQDQLLLSLFATAEAMGLQLTKGAALLMVDDLKDHDEPAVAEALKACRRNGGRLSVDTILKHLHAADGHPEPNEAWAIALQSFDESETVLITDEIQQAAAAAEPVMAGRDKIGARMAFLSAYQRLVDAARQNAKPVTWRLSLGHNPERRVSAVEEAQRLGRLPAPEAQRLLADLRDEPVSADGKAIAGLITGSGAMPTPELRARWQQLKSDIQASRHRKDVKARWDARRTRRDLAARRAEVLSTVEQLIAQRGETHELCE